MFKAWSFVVETVLMVLLWAACFQWGFWCASLIGIKVDSLGTALSGNDRTIISM